MPKRRPSSARPRRPQRAASARRSRRQDPSRMRDGLRARVDEARRQDLEERVRRGMFSGGGGAGPRLHVQTVSGQRGTRFDGVAVGSTPARFRPQSARTRRDISPLRIDTGGRLRRTNGNVRHQHVQRRRRRPRSARQERPFSPIAEMAAASRLSPIASYRNEDGFAYQDDGGEIFMTYSEELEAEEEAYVLENAQAEVKTSMQRSRRGRRAQSTRKRRPLTAGRRRRVKRTRRGSARRNTSRSRPSTAANILRYSDNDSVGEGDDTNAIVADVASPNTRTALARSEDLLERARAYLLNRQGLSSNTRRFLEEKEQAIIRGRGGRQTNKLPTRGRRRRGGGGMSMSPPRRARPASAGRYHPVREEQFGMGAGRMVAASQGRLTSAADYDRFGLDELEQEVRQCLFDTQGVLEISRLVVKKLDKGRGVRVNVHISVDSSTSVLQAHEIATTARKAIFDVDGCIDDATVHVDAQPARNPSLGGMHSISDLASTGTTKSDSRSPLTTRSTNISRSPEKYSHLKQEVHTALAQIRDIFRVSLVKIKRDEQNTLAQVEILVNPELRIRRVHAVARRARELVETVAGIDKADVHLELDDGSKKDQDMAADRDSASENGYSRDGNSDTINPSSSSRPRAAIDSGEITMRGERSRSPSEYSYTYSDRGAHESESLPYSARSQTSDATNPNQQPPNQTAAMSTPQLLYGRPSLAGASGNAARGNRGISKKQMNEGVSGVNRARSTSRPISAHKLKREKRVLAIASDPTISPYITRINQRLMQSVLYRRFKYEKKLISIGTFMADADTAARGFMPAKPEFVRCLLSSELDLGLSAREADKLVEALLTISAGSGAEGMVRYGDFVETLRYVHKNAEQRPNETEPAIVGDDSRSQTPRSLASSDATSVGAETLRASSPSQGISTLSSTPVRPNPRVAQLQRDDLMTSNRARTSAMTPEQLTSAEAARKEMEQKLRTLKEAQEAELQKMRDELAAQKEATEQERLALEASKREHDEMIAAEKDEIAKRKRQEEEREQRERLKREWLAREQAQQKRAQMEKARKAKEDRVQQERLSKEALHIAEEQARLAAEKEKWEQQKRFDEEQAKLREERASAQKAAEMERLERERLAARLAAQDTELKKRQKDWEDEQKRMRQKEIELAELMRARESEKAELTHRLELEARNKVLIEEQARKREEEGIERVKEEIGELRSKEEAANRAKEATLRAKVAELEKARASDLRKSKEEAAIEADKARLAFEAELAAKSQEIARRVHEMEEKIQAEKEKAIRVAEENARLAKEAKEAKTLSQSAQKESAAAIAAKEVAANAIVIAEKARLKEEHERELEELRATLASEQGARVEATAAVEKAKKDALEAAERAKAAKEEADLVRRETERKRKAAEETRKRELEEAKEIAAQEARVAARAAADAEIAAVRREAAEALEKVKADAEIEARRLKEEMASDQERHAAISSPTTKLVFDPTHGDHIPQWSKIWDPRSQAYYYQDNFTGETSWDPHAAQWSESGEDHTLSAAAIPRNTPVKTKSPFMNRTVAARRIQCAFRGKIGRRRCRKQRGQVHAAMRQSIVDDHFASSPKHLRDSNLLKLPPSEQRWMKCDDPRTGSVYWYDTETMHVSWSPPSDADIKAHEDKMIAVASATDLINAAPDVSVDPLEESTDSLSKSMSLRERREMEAALKEAREHESPLKKKKKKKNKLRRKLSIDTDTALQPKGLVQPYESPENAAPDQSSSSDAAAYDGSSSSNNILTENNTERSSTQSIGMALTNTERSMGGGATERELAGGDTFPDFDVELPVMTKKNNLDGAAAVGTGGQPTWEALTTPMGRHIYWYDWSRGVSQWEKPSEVSQLSDSQLGHRVMPPTPKGQGASNGGGSGPAKGGDKAAELWDLLKRRSKVVATSVQAGWEELRDDRTGEHFFHSAHQGLFQWAKPAEWVDEVHIGGVGLPNGGWQEVTTPLGRSLYYINKSTGASQWERPAEMSTTSGRRAGEVDPKRAAMRLASTPKATSDAEKSAAAKLWVVLALRSTRVQVIGDWHEFFDPMTKETFYHNVGADEYSWERPEAMQHIAPVTVVGSVNTVAGKKLENAPAHIPRPKLKPISGASPGADTSTSPAKTHTPVQVWEPVATPKGKHLYYWNNETGESTWEKPTDTNPNAKISPDQKRVLQSPDTMAQLQESSEMWSQMRQHAIIEYVQGDWQCLLEHTTNQRFYHDTSTGKHQWEPPQLHGEWVAAGGQHVMPVPNQKLEAKQPEVWHEVRTPKGKNLYFFEATTGRSEWTLPSGVATVKEHGHLPPSTPKSGGGFEFDSPSVTQGAGNIGGGGGAATSVEPQAAAKMWQVLRARSKQVRHSGDWSELLDEASNEVFYHNSRDGTFTWEIPAELKIGQPGKNAAGGGDYSITL